VTFDRRARFAWVVLAFNMAVILFGAVVRATGSGAGCGGNWPDCNGGALPLAGTSEEAIEFSHRATSGVALLLVAVLVIWVFRTTSSGHPARFLAGLSGFFIVNEALVGAMLVLFGWTGEDASNGRAVAIALHLVNTLFLLATLVLTARVLSGQPALRRPWPASLRRPLIIGAVGFAIVGVAGAITALGDTLFPAESLLEGIRSDFTGTFLVRLRWIHPIVAVGVTGYLLWWAQGTEPGTGLGDRLGTALTGLLLVQVAFGALNVALLAPVWLQILHLLVADAAWLAFVLFGAEAIAVEQAAIDPAPA